MGYYTTLNGELYLSRVPSIEVWDTIYTELESFYLLSERDPSNTIYFGGVESKFYNLKNDASSLVCILEQVGITVSGEIICVGEGQPDIWRLVFKGGSVKSESPRIVWPDGTEYKA